MLRGFTDHSLDKNLLMKNSLEASRLNDDRVITVEYNNNMMITVVTYSKLCGTRVDVSNVSVGLSKKTIDA